MSMEDWGDIVMGKTQVRMEREALQGANRIKTLDELAEEGLEDNNELHELATMRKRGFEDWADGVVKGVGNTKRI